MMDREQYIFDDKRRMVRARFYELKESGRRQPPMYKLCTYDVFDFKPNGNRRSEKEKNNLLNRLYQEKRMDLKEKKEQKEQAALQEQKGLKVQVAMQNWLDHVTEFRNERTVTEYKLLCQRYIETVGDHPVQEVKLFHQENFLNALKRRGLSEHTQEKYLRQLQIFWNWAFDQEYVEKPVKITKLRPISREPGIFTLDYQHRLEELIKKKLNSKQRNHKLSALNQYRAFWCVKETGMRGAEICALKIANIDLDNKEIRIRDEESVRFRVKGRREEVVPISNCLLEFLREDLGNRKEEEIYYCDNGHGSPQWSSLNPMSKVFSRMRDELGVENVKPLHGFRAYVATDLLIKGVDSILVRDILRHKELSTTLKYVNRSNIPYHESINLLNTPAPANRLSPTLVQQDEDN